MIPKDQTSVVSPYIWCFIPYGDMYIGDPMFISW